ncbi:hypothetical protein R1sor_009573 [Riccia sorocarpa]|uniref:Mediator of RNA polymerase II transcription subunit 7 n=1 Tax=Riccia sorocarpa TaxID=122646 RepID=A0ABD3HY91_9MARC
MNAQAQPFLPQQGAPGEFTRSLFQPHFTFPVARPMLDMNQSADALSYVLTFRPNRVCPKDVDVGDNIDPDSDNEDGAGGDGAHGRKWYSWKIVILLEAKHDEQLHRALAPVRDGMHGTMAELDDVMRRSESDRLLVERELEQEHLAHHNRNRDKICDVLKSLVGAMADVPPRM